MRIIVATDGEPAALGALRVARALAERHRARVEVISVVAPFPVPPSRVGGPEFVGIDGLVPAACGAARQRVGAQLAEAGPGCTAWPTAITIGPPAPTIARMADDRDATLIVIGQGRHALADRWLGSETALRVIRLSPVPVLVVPSDARTLPDCAVAAVDFSDFSHLAARAALDVLGPDARLHLAHVFWRPSEGIPWVGGHDWVEDFKDRARRELEEMARTLDGTAGVHVGAELLEGDPAGEILRLAAGVGAGLVTAGSHGTGFLGRILMGSVSTRLVRGASCMVLVVPPRTVPAERAAVPAAAPARVENDTGAVLAAPA
jgi:nucleotide-binding universal stress UspA family protein